MKPPFRWPPDGRTLCLVLLLPWLVRTPRNLQRQFEKLHLSATHGLSRHERRVHFLQVQMERLQDDYFALLRAAETVLDGRACYYEFVSGGPLPHPPAYTALQARAFSNYWLTPCRLAGERHRPRYILYYRMAPPPGAGRLLRTVDGPTPSHIVEVAP